MRTEDFATQQVHQQLQALVKEIEDKPHPLSSSDSIIVKLATEVLINEPSNPGYDKAMEDAECILNAMNEKKSLSVADMMILQYAMKRFAKAIDSKTVNMKKFLDSIKQSTTK